MAKKKSSPVHARDSVSSDSLSFAGLVCIQDFSAQTQSNIPSTLAKNSEFEFGYVTQNTHTVNQNSNCPADILFYKGQLLPQVIQPQPNQDQLLRQSNSEKALQTVGNNSKRSAVSDSNLNNGASQHNGHVKSSPSKKDASAGQSFGQKILRLATPCRDCRATETIASTKPLTLR